MATVTSKGDVALTNSIIDRSITEIEDEMCGSVGKRAFINCSVLEKADFSDVQRIKEEAFRGCSSLNALILRKNSVCTFENNALVDTPIANGDGYIYVPTEKVDATKGNCVYPDKVRAIEDYPEVCSRLGKVWKQSNVTAGKYRHAAYAGGLYLAGSKSNNDIVYYSTDGKTWTSSNVTNKSLHIFAYHDGMWQATGSSGLYYSTDGKKWTQNTTVSGAGNAMIFTNGMWIWSSTTGVYYSTDGKTWTSTNLTTNCYVVKYHNGVFVAGTALGLYYSTDGATWTQSSITSGRFSEVECENGVFVAGTESNSSLGLYYSTDGVTWTRSNITSGACVGILYADGLWVAVSGKLYYSTDGKVWVQGNPNANWRKLAYGEGTWVGANYTGLYYSADGMSWTRSHITTACDGVAYGDGIFVASADGLVYSEV